MDTLLPRNESAFYGERYLLDALSMVTCPKNHFNLFRLLPLFS